MEREMKKKKLETSRKPGGKVKENLPGPVPKKEPTQSRDQAAKKDEECTDLEVTYSGPKDISLSEMIRLRNRGLSYEEIGRIVGCSKPNVWSRLEPYRKHIDGLPAFKEARADLLAVHQSRLLDSLSDEEIEKMPPGSRVVNFGILYDKERLERGQSTSNVCYADFTRSIQDLDREIQKLEAEIEAGERDPD
jgi:hypothetical protein